MAPQAAIVTLQNQRVTSRKKSHYPCFVCVYYLRRSKSVGKGPLAPTNEFLGRYCFKLCHCLSFCSQGQHTGPPSPDPFSGHGPHSTGTLPLDLAIPGHGTSLYGDPPSPILTPVSWPLAPASDFWQPILETFSNMFT